MAGAVRVNLANTGSQQTGGAGSDILKDIENLVGGAGNDILTGNDLGNRLEGGAGGDTFTGGRGADTAVGGLGNDSYYIDDALDTVVELAGEGTDLVLNAIDWTLGEHFENLTVTGVMAVNGTGNASANVLLGNGAANILSGLGGDDALNGASGNDTLLGGDGADTVTGGSGADQMEGGAGHDHYVVDSASDRVIEAVGGGFDVVTSSASFTLGVEVEKLVLTGTSNLSGTGGATANELVGNGGANALSGGAGADVLDGGLGADTLTGGSGADAFRFSTALNGSVDRIGDLVTADDTIWLDNAIFTALAEGVLTAAALQVGTDNVAQSADVRIIYNTATGALLYDADGQAGTASAVQFATVSVAGLVGSLSVADFLVI
jgi:Ca2+-binding RTX toxin-like protein